MISAVGGVDEAAVKLFGDPLRARIVRLPAREQTCTCRLVEESGARRPTVSRPPKILREPGSVATEPRGRFTCYRPRPDAAAEVARAVGARAAAAERARDSYRPC